MITPVIYEEISNELCSTEEASRYYFYQNAIGICDKIYDEYESYELEQIQMRNKVVSNAIRSENLQMVPDLDTTVFGVSGIKNKVVLITELK